jgi:hypothetical protein
VLSVMVENKTAAAARARLRDCVHAVARTFHSWRRNILIPPIRHIRGIILYHKKTHTAIHTEERRNKQVW